MAWSKRNGNFNMNQYRPRFVCLHISKGILFDNSLSGKVRKTHLRTVRHACLGSDVLTRNKKLTCGLLAKKKKQNMAVAPELNI